MTPLAISPVAVPMIGLSDHIDLALITLYLFWVFFFGLVAWLNREGMREGFPAVSEMTGKPLGGTLPRPKSFKLDDGTVVKAPRPEVYQEPANATPSAPWGGSPYEPVGDPMLSEFGPSAYAQRLDTPLKTFHGALKIAPMRHMPDFSVVSADRDPRDLPVIAADNVQAGVVSDIWIDREEQMIRYLEVLLDFDVVKPEPPHTVLLPMTMAVVGGRLARFGAWRPEVRVRSILARQFKDVPRTALPDQVTLLEEDKITAYYGGGTLYATPSRREPWL